MSLTGEQIADALDCFWNASLGHAINAQDSTAMAVAGSLSEGFAAIARRLREQLPIDPRDARIAALEAQLAAMPTLEQMQAYQDAAERISRLADHQRHRDDRLDFALTAFDALPPLIKQTPAREETK